VQATETAHRILKLREEHRKPFTDKLGYSAGHGHRVLEHLYERPIVSVNDIRDLTGTPAANQLIERLVSREVTPMCDCSTSGDNASMLSVSSMTRLVKTRSSPEIIAPYVADRKIRRRRAAFLCGCFPPPWRVDRAMVHVPSNRQRPGAASIQTAPTTTGLVATSHLRRLTLSAAGCATK
jgi:hypothetical protein